MIGDATVTSALSRLDRHDRGLTFLESNTYLSFAELDRSTMRLAARWAGLGLTKGERVLVIATDEREFALALLSAMRAGVVPVPMFPPFAFGSRESYAEGLRRVAKAADVSLCLANGSAAAEVNAAGLSCRHATLADVEAAPPGSVPVIAPEDPALIQFTSGSTGDPKGAVVSNRALIAHARSLTEALAMDGAVDRAVSWLPLYHDMGLTGKLLSAVLCQIPVWYMSPLRFIKDPIGYLRVMSEVQGTMSFAPCFAYGLLARRGGLGIPADIDLSAWRVAGCGAEPVRVDVLRGFAAVYASAGFSASALVPCYGMAEATLAVCTTVPGRGMGVVRAEPAALGAGRVVVTDAAEGRELVSSGRPLPTVDIEIKDESGRRLPDGMIGEITVAADFLADGYFRNEEETGRTWRDGRLHTGDTGFLRDGELYVTGRIKDLIIVNGRNHQPQDIERIAEGVEGVRWGNVIALPMRRGDSEGVRIVLEAAGNPPAPGLCAQVAAVVQREAGVPVGDVVLVRKGTLAKTSSGKPRRQHTAAMFETGRLARVDGQRRREQDET